MAGGEGESGQEGEQEVSVHIHRMIMENEFRKQRVCLGGKTVLRYGFVFFRGHSSVGRAPQWH